MAENPSAWVSRRHRQAVFPADGQVRQHSIAGADHEGAATGAPRHQPPERLRQRLEPDLDHAAGCRRRLCRPVAVASVTASILTPRA